MNDDDALADPNNPAPQGLPSRTAQKRAAQARQTLGTALTQLSDEQLQPLALPERLQAALVEYRRLKARGARRRQLQFIGALMRDLDPVPIQALIDELSGQSAEARYQHHQLELWRERLLTEPAALTEFIDRYPAVDRQQLRQLVDKARRGAGPKTREAEAKRTAKLLFRFLKAATDSDQDA